MAANSLRPELGMKTTVRRRLVRTVLSIVIAVALLIVATVSWDSIQVQAQHSQAIAQNIKASILSKGRVLVENQSLSLRGMIEDNAYGDVKKLMARTLRQDKDVILGALIDEEGTAWGYYGPDAPAPDAANADAAPISEGWKALGLTPVQGDGLRVETKRWFNQEIIVFSQAMHGEDGRLGTVHYGLSTASMTRTLAEARAKAKAALSRELLMLGGLAAVGALLGYLLARGTAKRITAPLKELTHAAEQIAQGKREVRANVDCGDEIQVLAGAFNQMVADLDASYGALALLNQGLELKVAERTKMLAARNAEMRVVLDNVEEGLVTVGLDGSMSGERSAAYQKVFASPANDTKIWDSLGHLDPKFRERFEFAWDQVKEGFLPWDIALDQLPRDLRVEDRYFELRFRPIFREAAGEEQTIDGALVIAADVTAEVEARRVAAIQREEMALFRRLASDRHGFMQFFDEVSEIAARVLGGKIQDPTEFMRSVHTIKGNCALYGIESVAAVCHELEAYCVENGAICPAEMVEQFRVSWGDFAARVSELLGSRDPGELVLSAVDVAKLTQVAKMGERSQMVSTLQWLQCEPTARQFDRLREQSETLAKRLGKPIQVQVEHHDIRLPLTPKWQTFWSNMAHVVRNALDHGIEPSEARANAGKPALGTVSFRSSETRTHFVIEVSDDGRGIDWPAIARRAESEGLPHQTEAELVAALFTDGVSSRQDVTDLSGRGVGTAAVRQACLAMGGEVKVASEVGKGATFAFHIPKLNNDASILGKNAA
jgi:two-component system, chemotaxis family, sensor kinase CheA